MLKATEPAREVPVLSEVDVAVVGGGTAGVMAAVGAAREGARTCVIERWGHVGGMIDIGLMGHFGNMYRARADGRELIQGAPRELLARVVADGATPYGDLEEALRAGMHIFYRHTHAGMECLRMLAEAKVELWLHACFARAARAPGGGYDLFIECKGGRRAIRARQVIDCTGEADVAFSLGAAMQEEKTLRYSWGLLFEMGLVDVDRYVAYLKGCDRRYPEWDAWLAKQLNMTAAELEGDRYWREWVEGRPRAWPFRREIVRAVEAGDLALRRALPEGGMVRYGWDGFWPEPWHGADTVTANVCMVTGLNPADPRHVSIAETGARAYALDFLRFLRKYLPGFERAVIRTISGQTVPRGGREIVGEDRLRPEDYGGAAPREDAVCVVGSAGAALPLGMFAPKGFADLLVAGRCADQGYSVRGSVCCMAAGFSCGVIAAIAARQGRTPMQLDRAQWRDALKRHGVLLAPGPAAGTALSFQELPGVPAPDGADGLARAKKLS
jgi:hypothetical protein